MTLSWRRPLLAVLWALLGFGAAQPLFASEFPWGKPDGYVTDRAGLLSSEAKTRIAQVIANLEAKTGAEIAVATMDSMGPGDIKGVAVSIFNGWGIGKKGKDNGLLILLAQKERKVHIEVGYGLEHVITDGLAGNIIRSVMAPHLKAGDFDTAFLNAVTALANAVAADAGVDLGTGAAPPPPEEKRPDYTMNAFILIFAVFFSLIRIVFQVLRHSRSGGWDGGGWGGGGWSGGGGWGGGGGFGGFGGGRSGGGGASGGW